MAFSSSDSKAPSRQGDTVASTHHVEEKRVLWSIDLLNCVSQLRHIADTPEINIGLNYIGEAVTFFFFM